VSDNRDKALKIIADLSGKPVGELKSETELVAHLGIDSPKALQLLVELEDGLSIEISDEQAARMETVGDVLAFVEKT
jgi:acyl carrier protein